MNTWEEIDNSLQKTFSFESFNDAMRFMQACAPIIDDMDHHPEWSNVYTTVSVTLTTHDAGSVTEKDRTLAQKMDEVYERMA